MGKFKVGDRVRFIQDNGYGGQGYGKAGEAATVTRIWSDSGVDVKLEGGRDNGYNPIVDVGYLELAPPVAKWEPKVGDRVVEEKSAGGVDLVEHWNKNFRLAKGDLVGGAFVVTSVSSKGYVGCSNKLGGDQFYVFAKHIKPAPVQASAALAIEAGKFYLDTDGQKVGPMVRLSVWHDYPIYEKDAVGRWSTTGTAAKGKSYGNRQDLVAEWVEPTAPVLATTPTAIVALIENGEPKPATKPFVHATKEAAEKEALRLATQHKGQEFGVYVYASSTTVAKPVYDQEWKNLAASGEKIAAVKALRVTAGLALKPAKDAVEYFLAAA